MKYLKPLTLIAIVATLFIMPITSALIGTMLATVFFSAVGGMLTMTLTEDKEFSYLIGGLIAIVAVMYFSDEILHIWNNGHPFSPFSDWNNHE